MKAVIPYVQEDSDYLERFGEVIEIDDNDLEFVGRDNCWPINQERVEVGREVHNALWRISERVREGFEQLVSETGHSASHAGDA